MYTWAGVWLLSGITCILVGLGFLWVNLSLKEFFFEEMVTWSGLVAGGILLMAWSIMSSGAGDLIRRGDVRGLEKAGRATLVIELSIWALLLGLGVWMFGTRGRIGGWMAIVALVAVALTLTRVVIRRATAKMRGK
jgi:hypothetical protein